MKTKRYVKYLRLRFLTLDSCGPNGFHLCTEAGYQQTGGFTE
jgi:hypothetical protein